MHHHYNPEANHLFTQGMLMIAAWAVLLITHQVLKVKRTNEYGVEVYGSWPRLLLGNLFSMLVALSQPVAVVGGILVVAGGAFG